MGKKWIEVVLGPGRVVRYSGNECVPADGVVFQLEEVLVRGQKRLSCGKKCKDGDCLVLNEACVRSDVVPRRGQKLDEEGCGHSK
jgi:hypothetical protein